MRLPFCCDDFTFISISVYPTNLNNPNNISKYFCIFVSMSAIDGKFLGLAVNGQFTPCELACSINGETEMLPTSSSVNGSYRSFRPGYKSWEMSVDGRVLISSLPSAVNSLLDTWDARIPIPVSIGQRSPNGQPFALYGQAYIRNFSLNAANTGKANYTVQFQGTGILTRDITIFYGIISAMPATADYPPIQLI